MDWYVEIAVSAEEDIEEIYQYIAISLGEPNVAWNQTERIRDKIGKLSFMPERNPVIQEEPWKSREVRRVNVDNYAVFYLLDRKPAKVTVIRVLYSRRDLSSVFLQF